MNAVIIVCLHVYMYICIVPGSQNGVIWAERGLMNESLYPGGMSPMLCHWTLLMVQSY